MDACFWRRARLQAPANMQLHWAHYIKAIPWAGSNFRLGTLFHLFLHQNANSSEEFGAKGSVFIFL